MRKIFGKIIIIFISLFVVYVDAHVFMEVRTENGEHNKVVVGQPFTLEVSISDVYGSVQPPKIKGAEKFFIRQSGTYMSSVNGKSTARFSYQVRIDTIGSYVLGPAIVMLEQQQLVSNEVQIDVVKDIGVTASNSKNNQAVGSKTFLRLMVDSESVVVGQKIGCVLRFYYQDPSLSLHNINMPELPGFDIKDTGMLESGTAEIDGVRYKYAQWQWHMYPMQPGEFIIPAYNADYDLPSKDNNLLGGLFMFINNRVDRKRVYSNAVTIKVSPLPHSDKPVHAVGVFERISADIKPGVAKTGEGMVLVVEIEGEGNLDAIAVPVLKMPEALKYYDSHSAIIPSKHSDELPKKRFEFIVQGMQAGCCEIPEQLFTYFDIERNAYVTLRTSPLAVSIMPGMNNSLVSLSPKTSEAESILSFAQEEDKSRPIRPDVAHINVVGQWYPVAESPFLPWWLFELLFLFPCIYLGYPFLIEKCVALTGSSRRLMRRRAFKKAQKQIAIAVKTGDDKKLYTIFVELLQELEQITEKPCREHITVLFEGWNDYFERITHTAYAQNNAKNADELCRMAKQWIERLEKTL